MIHFHNNDALDAARSLWAAMQGLDEPTWFEREKAEGLARQVIEVGPPPYDKSRPPMFSVLLYYGELS